MRFDFPEDFNLKGNIGTPDERNYSTDGSFEMFFPSYRDRVKSKLF